MTVLLKYRDGVHVYDNIESAIAKQAEIGGELFGPMSTIAALTAERDGLLADGQFNVIALGVFREWIVNVFGDREGMNTIHQLLEETAKRYATESEAAS